MGIDRYKYLLKKDGTLRTAPPVKIKERAEDIFRVYDSSRTRLDRISADVYNDDSYGWLILLGNPEYGMEFDIPTGTVIRVPYPLREALSEYESKIIKNRDVG